MPDSPLRLLRSLRRGDGLGGESGLTDAELLGRFLADRDPAAFEVLVWRHAAIVRSACRRVLRHAADVEDAFQATFLVLLRKAGSIRDAEAVGPWLWHVAHRVAVRPSTPPDVPHASDNSLR